MVKLFEVGRVMCSVKVPDYLDFAFLPALAFVILLEHFMEERPPAEYGAEHRDGSPQRKESVGAELELPGQNHSDDV